MAYLLYYLYMNTTKKALWFKAKRYGWGWYPATWQGVVLTLVFCLCYAFLLVLFLGWLGAATMAGGADYRDLSLGILEFMAGFALLTWSMIALCTRFGEKPGWRWGDPK